MLLLCFGWNKGGRILGCPMGWMCAGQKAASPPKGGNREGSQAPASASWWRSTGFMWPFPRPAADTRALWQGWVSYTKLGGWEYFTKKINGAGVQLLFLCVPILYLELNSGRTTWCKFLVNLQFYAVFFSLSRIIAYAQLLVNFFIWRSPNRISNHVLSCQVPTSPHKIKCLKQVIVILWKRIIIFQVDLIFEYCCNGYNLHFKISKQPCACSPQDPGVSCRHRRQPALQSPCRGSGAGPAAGDRRGLSASLRGFDSVNDWSVPFLVLPTFYLYCKGRYFAILLY